jgi:hypothetical protein
MEHWTHLANSKVAFCAAVLVFALGVIVWLAWARFFPESGALKKLSHFVMALAGLIFFAGGYAYVVARGLDGVACVVGRHSRHVVCFTRDESPVAFWVLISVLTGLSGVLLLVAAACMMLALSPAERRGTARGNAWRSIGRVGDERPASRGAVRWPVFQALGGAAVMLPLAWIAVSFHRADGARKQVAEALSSVAGEKAAVETYLRDNGVLPEDNGALGLPPPAHLAGLHASEIEVAKGSIILKFDGASVDEHLRGRHVMSIAVRRDKAVAWHCASPDIDDKYLPRPCRIPPWAESTFGQ